MEMERSKALRLAVMQVVQVGRGKTHDGRSYGIGCHRIGGCHHYVVPDVIAPLRSIPLGRPKTLDQAVICWMVREQVNKAFLDITVVDI
ncbi:MAG: hypothetical protein BWY79_01991 [Actinobacteria bacterium ADurb.Bin444]|nr:MAG: hypothetical protein BWY79_01991 [Actinobacteria bacterium ADurb.Bin444]